MGPSDGADEPRQGGVTGLVDRAGRRGLVRRIPDPDARRSIRVGGGADVLGHGVLGGKATDRVAEEDLVLEAHAPGAEHGCGDIVVVLEPGSAPTPTRAVTFLPNAPFTDGVPATVAIT